MRLTHSTEYWEHSEYSATSDRGACRVQSTSDTWLRGVQLGGATCHARLVTKLCMQLACKASSKLRWLEAAPCASVHQVATPVLRGVRRWQPRESRGHKARDEAGPALWPWRRRNQPILHQGCWADAVHRSWYSGAPEHVWQVAERMGRERHPHLILHAHRTGVALRRTRKASAQQSKWAVCPAERSLVRSAPSCRWLTVLPRPLVGAHERAHAMHTVSSSPPRLKFREISRNLGGFTPFFTPMRM